MSTSKGQIGNWSFRADGHKISALDTIRKASLQKIGKYTKQDIREPCPSLSISSVEGTLRRMVAEDEIKREGSGKNTFYYRIK